MGKKWDEDKGGRKQWVAWMQEVMTECLRVMKPGAHGLVWAIPRTSHWTATALEDAGFEIRDRISHLFGQGFPKSLNINKALGELVCACQETVTNMSDMQEELQAEESDSLYKGQDVQLSMSGCTKVKQTGNVGTPEKGKQIRGTSGQHAGGKQAEVSSFREEPSLEGRCDIQTQQRQLHRPQVREVSPGVYSNGSKGRVHNGAPPSDGDTLRPYTRASGGSTPQGSQHTQQFDRESGAISEQFSPQTCRSCGKKKVQSGIGTALKPSVEDWWLIRKPCEEDTVAKNVLKWGCGGINIDASRVGTETITQHKRDFSGIHGNKYGPGVKQPVLGQTSTTIGRFPANLILSHNPDCVEVGTKRVGSGSGSGYNFEESNNDNPTHITRNIKSGVHYGTETVSAFECTDGCAVRLLDEQSGVLKSGGGIKMSAGRVYGNGHTHGKAIAHYEVEGLGKSQGGASRFFYCAKASKKDKGDNNTHPTVKSSTLMAYLITMITPPDGLVLDPFMGSGSTGVAAIKAGFNFVGIEKEVEYANIAEARLKKNSAA